MNVPHKTAKAIAASRATLACLPLPPEGGCQVKPGHETPVRHGGKAATCRVKVLSATGHRLGDTTHAEAKAMGHKTLTGFREQWLRDHDPAWANRHGDLLGVLEAGDIAGRFETRWASQTVWLVKVQLVDDRPRYLAACGRGDIERDGNADYTHQRGRAIDELEVIDPATQARFSKTAEGFCIGRQLARAKEAATHRRESPRGTQRAERGRSWRDAA